MSPTTPSIPEKTGRCCKIGTSGEMGAVYVPVASLALNGGADVQSPPSSWVQIAALTTLSNPKAYAYYHVAGSSEPASYTWTLSAAVTNSGAIARYSGVDNASPLDAPPNTAASLAVSSFTVPSVTATSGAMLIGGVALNSSNATVLITAPAGMSERWDLAGRRQEYDHTVEASAGSSGAKTWTFSTARDATGWLAALRPAP